MLTGHIFAGAGCLGILLSLVPSLADEAAFEFSQAGSRSQPRLPSYLKGKPAPLQAHVYSSGATHSPHTAFGAGLHVATTGVPASFTINVVGEQGEPLLEQWSRGHQLFLYVWIANPNQIFIAEVVDNGNGTLTATYESSFPGDYLVYVEEVALGRHDEGRPIEGSPFSLTVSGMATIDVDTLPVCNSVKEKPSDSFWSPGSWVSSNIASAYHGVDRNGWIFQPRACALEAFSYEDLAILAGSKRRTWLLVLGDSVFRGVFLTLVDMVLESGQKGNLADSIIQKCWGYAEVRVGNLRLTYQDMRLYQMNDGDDSLVCNDEKLSSGGQSEYIRSCKHFFADTVFGNDTSWPTVVVAPSHLRRSSTTIDVPIGMIPGSWKGRIVFLEHMDAFGNFHWGQENPTMTRYEDVGMTYHGGPTEGSSELNEMDRYYELDPRVTFRSVFPMLQGQLFENQQTTKYRTYGGSQHFHYVKKSFDNSTYGGVIMVESTITEMLANIIVSEAVGTKEDMYKLEAATERNANNSREFYVCTDCPRGLLPIHLKSPPELSCTTSSSLDVRSGPAGKAWDGSLCPSWCMKQNPVSVLPTESGPVSERRCETRKTYSPGGA